MPASKLHNLIKYTKKLNVLYVEDNLEVQSQTVKMLQSFFNTICVADNGKIGLELFFGDTQYHIIITDIKMPLIDGLSLIDTVRKENKKIPILILSAYDDKDYFLKTINAGIDGYILKPYTLTQIIETLTNIIDKYDFKDIDNEIVELDFDFFWNKKNSQLYKNNEPIKLSRNETKLFEVFIINNELNKSYKEIETFIFDYYENDVKKIRNLVSRLKLKLDYDLFETIYSHGYSIKYKTNL